MKLFLRSWRLPCLVALAAGSMLSAGCANTLLARYYPVMKAPVRPPMGVIYTKVDAPLDVDFSDEGTASAANPSKVGESSAEYIGLPYYRSVSVAWGDASIEEAMAEGGISEASYADYEMLSVLGVYHSAKIRVYGE